MRAKGSRSESRQPRRSNRSVWMSLTPIIVEEQRSGGQASCAATDCGYTHYETGLNNSFRMPKLKQPGSARLL
jgi:hypothetical protein